jgi:hypothetical protein
VGSGSPLAAVADIAVVRVRVGNAIFGVLFHSFGGNGVWLAVSADPTVVDLLRALSF